MPLEVDKEIPKLTGLGFSPSIISKRYLRINVLNATIASVIARILPMQALDP